MENFLLLNSSACHRQKYVLVNYFSNHSLSKETKLLALFAIDVTPSTKLNNFRKNVSNIYESQTN